MTVKELRERLKDYPDDMLVVVEDISVCISKDVSEDYIYDHDFIRPSICKTTCTKELYENYEWMEKRVKKNGEEWTPNCGEDYFNDYTAVSFKPKADCNVKIKERLKEAVLVIGELNEKIDYTDIEHFDEIRVLKEVLLIS